MTTFHNRPRQPFHLQHGRIPKKRAQTIKALIERAKAETGRAPTHAELAALLPMSADRVR